MIERHRITVIDSAWPIDLAAVVAAGGKMRIARPPGIRAPRFFLPFYRVSGFFLFSE